MVGPIDLAAEIPAERAANDDIRREVLLASHAGGANPGGQSISHDFGERSGILVRQYARH